KRLLDAFPLRIVAITLRENPLVWKNAWAAIACQGQTILRTRTYEVEIVDRLGAGDSFAAGLIHGLLDDDLQKGLDYGVAASAINYRIIERSGLPIVVQPDLASLPGELTAAAWVVDALFGTGLTGAVRSPFDAIIAAVNAGGRPVLAVDIPSGLDCDTGLTPG